MAVLLDEVAYAAAAVRHADPRDVDDRYDPVHRSPLSGALLRVQYPADEFRDAADEAQRQTVCTADGVRLPDLPFINNNNDIEGNNNDTSNSNSNSNNDNSDNDKGKK